MNEPNDEPTATPTADSLGRCWQSAARRFVPLGAEVAAATGWEVFNPGRYGESWHARFRRCYPLRARPLLVCGLNPGPYGMAQSGIPFTDLKRLAAELPRFAAELRAAGSDLALPGLAPPGLRPYLTRTFESSSVRVYRFLRLAYGSAERAFTEIALLNPCPLLFIDPRDGANRTPADLPRAVRASGAALDRARAFVAKFDAARLATVEEAIDELAPRGVVLFGRDVEAALAEPLTVRLGAARVVAWEHPARAVPERWSHGLADLLTERGLLHRASH